jgi:3-deoxy-7-phosphoheptulonate synthase
MSTHRLNNVNIQSVVMLPTPRDLRSALPQTAATCRTVIQGRETVERVLDREDPRLLAIVGPCSIHDMRAAREYADRLIHLAAELDDALFVLMRVYFEKPRTALGWKGFINDPYMNDTFRIDEGLRMARQFLLDVSARGMPVATEALDPLTPQYIGDLISWTAIGARTTESQTHREIASGLSTPVGFKNATDGSIDAAVNALKAALGPHHFLGVTEEGLPAVFGTTGNPYPHIVLRGGSRPNYDAASIRQCEEALRRAGLPESLIIDCSHGNSGKAPEKQVVALRDVIGQIESGNRSVVGFMLESYLEAGSQPLAKSAEELRYGVSVTDACLDWTTTESILREVHARFKRVMNGRKK